MERDPLVDVRKVMEIVKPMFAEYDKVDGPRDRAFKAMDIIRAISGHYEKVVQALVDRVNTHEQESGRILVELVAIKDQNNRIIDLLHVEEKGGANEHQTAS